MRDCDGWFCSAARMWLSPLSLQRCRDRRRGSGICLPGPRFAQPNGHEWLGRASLVTRPSVRRFPAPAWPPPHRAATASHARLAGCTRCAALQSQIRVSSHLACHASPQPGPPETRQSWKIAASAAAGQTEIRGAPSFISPFAISPDQPAASASVSPHPRPPFHHTSGVLHIAPPSFGPLPLCPSAPIADPAPVRTFLLPVTEACLARFALRLRMIVRSPPRPHPPPPRPLPRHMHLSPSACCLASAVPLPPAPPASAGGMNPHAPLPVHAYRWCGCGDHRGYASPCPSAARPVPCACVPRDGFPCPPPPSLRPTVHGAHVAVGSLPLLLLSALCARVCAVPPPLVIRRSPIRFCRPRRWYRPQAVRRRPADCHVGHGRASARSVRTSSHVPSGLHPPAPASTSRFLALALEPGLGFCAFQYTLSLSLAAIYRRRSSLVPPRL